MTEAIDDEIRRLRNGGELLGPLIDRFGSEAIVRALGVSRLADELGVSVNFDVCDSDLGEDGAEDRDDDDPWPR